MMSALLAQGVGLSIWMASLTIPWFLIGRRRRLPAALWLPGFVAALPIAFVLRGLFGDASFALPALAYYASSVTLPAPSTRRFLAVAVIVAVTLYISALGFLTYDLYSIGYEPSFAMLGVAAALFAAYRWMPVLAWLWLLGLGLFSAGLHPSPNLWDTLIDLPATGLAAYLVTRKRPSYSVPDADAGDCLSVDKAPSDSSRPASG